MMQIFRGLVVYAFSIWLIFSFQSCSQKNADKTGHDGPSNALINETSPYLLQHAYNPVSWYPWGDNALEKANGEEKLLVISIGYAACHWCHVMEKESFSDSLVAAVMNENFVSIKVDREERPDVDKIYMDAAMLLSGRGGWPLNIIALPDGKPVFAATYLPKNNWLSLLNFFIEKQENSYNELVEQAEKVTQGVQSLEMVGLVENEKTLQPSMLVEQYARMVPELDFKWGGRKGSPKFPTPVIFDFLLQHYYYSNQERALEAVTTTLDQIARGGIYDHVGGGFARYSTDSRWHIPHFEKMLYDNAQLVGLYSEAYRQTKNPLYRQVVEETLTWLTREMTDASGGFYSSLDADSDGEEGKFYVWTATEVDQILADDASIFKEYYGITTRGNWEEGKNVLKAVADPERILGKYNMSSDELEALLLRSKKALLGQRENRVRPGLDNKILTSWNSLMITGLVKAYLTFQEPEYLAMAERTANFLKEHQIGSGGKVFRNYKDGQSTINGFLDDYAFTIEAFLKLYEATFDEQWLEQAQQIRAHAIESFWDESSRMFFYTSSEDAPLIARKMDLTDDVIPSANAVMAQNIFLLGTLYYDEEQIALALQMLQNILPEAAENPMYYAKWLSLQSKMTYPQFEVAIVGADFSAKRNELYQYYRPNAILLGGENEGSLQLLENKYVEGKTMIYVCQNKTCRLPVQEVSQAITQIN